MEIRTERIEIPLEGGGVMGGYLARPDDGEARPAVLVFMEIFGINAHIRDITERIAEEGYVALAPDYFHRTGPGVELDYDDAGMAEGMKLLGGLRADEMVSDARAALTFLRASSGVQGDRIGATGFCIGGHMTYLTACETDIQVAASFYGGGIAAPQGPGGGASTVSKTPGIQGKMVCFFGAEDGMIPQSQVGEIRAALEAAGTRHEIHVYEGADHGFNCDRRASYNEEAATDAWGRMVALFGDKLLG